VIRVIIFAAIATAVLAPVTVKAIANAAQSLSAEAVEHGDEQRSLVAGLLSVID